LKAYRKLGGNAVAKGRKDDFFLTKNCEQF
jgi:hypothetical protein